MPEPEPMVMPVCDCGRMLRLLNPASDTPKCSGCGWTVELCTCTAETRPMELPNV